MSERKRLEELFFSGKISRREFLARASALGLAATLAPSMLVPPVRAAKIKRGGRFRIASTGGSTTDQLDPGTLTSNWNQIVNYQLRNCLTEINHKFTPIPELAESWEASPDAKVWRFHLRKGVEFHNGKTLTAEDVIYTMNHHRQEDSKSAAKPLLKPVKEIKAEGKYTVVFTLESGNADWPFVVSDYHLTIFPAGTQGADFDKGIGTGPFMLKSWEPGVRAFTVRNSNYWKEGKPYFDEVETLSIPDVNARTNALKTGQIDYMDRCERKTLHLLERVPNIQVIRARGTTHYTMPMLVDIPPYGDNNVRLALKHAVDREELLKLILRGYGYLGNDHPIGKNQRYYASELPQRQYDPDKARFYMKKAGMLDHTFNLHAADAAFAGAVDAAVLYAESAARAGIKIKVVREPDDGYWSRVWTKKEWCMCYWGGRPSEDMMFTTAYAADAPWNDMHWKHERFNKLLKEARAELNEAKRREMYVEMQRIVRDEGGVVVPVFADIVEAAAKNVGYEPYAADKEFMGLRVAERCWFTS